MAVQHAPSTDIEPKSINHYTDLNGFIGIIGKSQLWASNVAYLNDREELEHGIKCAEKALAGLLKDRRLAVWKEPIKEAVISVKEGLMPNTYATCFCTKPDLLSQWRGYGGQKQGVGLTFDIEGLKSLLPSKKSYLTPVTYGVVTGKQGIAAGLHEHLSGIAAEMLDGLDEIGKADEAFQALCKLIPKFKHIGFKPESEWRIVVQQDTIRDSVQYRAAGNVIVPYITIGSEGASLPLKAVKIGPGSDTELTRKSVHQFLRAKGYHNVPVEVSRVPFRT